MNVCFALTEGGSYGDVGSGVTAVISPPALTTVTASHSVYKDVATTLTLTTTGVARSTLPWIKIVGSGDACTDVHIAGGNGQLAYVENPNPPWLSAITATFWVKITAAASTGNKVCYSETQGGTYTDSTVTLTVLSPTVDSVTIPTSYSSIATTLTFVTTGLANDESLPWIKIIAPGGTCASDAAVAGGSGQIEFTSASAGTLILTLTPAPAAAYVVCYATTSSSTYSALTSTPNTITITAPAVVSMGGYTSASQGITTSLFFTTAGMVADGTRPWIKIVGTGIACADAAGDADGEAGGKGQLVFINAEKGVLDVTMASAVAADYTVCYSPTQAGTYASLSGGAVNDFAVVAPTVASLTSPITSYEGLPVTLTFVTTGLVNDKSRPWVKMVPSSGSCADAAIAGTSGQLTFVSAVSGTIVLIPLVISSFQPHFVCWSLQQTGTYAVLTETFTVTAAEIKTLSSSAATIKGLASTMTFTAGGLRTTVGTYIKIIATGNCGDVAGTSDAIAQGAGAVTPTTAVTGVISSTEATFTLVTTQAVGTGMSVCYAVTEGGTYLPLTTTPVTTFAITAPVAPTVVSATPDTMAMSVDTVFTFTVTNLVSDATRPWIKLVAAGSACSTAALAGTNTVQMDFISHTQGSATLHISETWTTDVHMVLCYADTMGGTYAALIHGDVVAFHSQTPTGAPTQVPTSAPTMVAPQVVSLDNAPVRMFKNIPATMVFTMTSFDNAFIPPHTVPWIKMVASGTTCGAVDGVSDAIEGGWGHLTYNSNTQGTLAITHISPVSVGNHICWSPTKDGTYAALTGGAATQDISDVRMESLSTASIKRNVPQTLTFVADGLANDATLPWVIIIANGGTCASETGTSGALAGGKGQVVWSSTTSAYITLTFTAAVASVGNEYVVCYSLSEAGTYAALETTAGALVVDTPTVSSVTPVTVYKDIATVFTFVTVGLANDLSRPWIHIIPNAATCGAASAVAGGTGYQLTYVSAISATVTMTITAAVTSGSDYVVCYADTEAGTYATIGAGAALAVTSPTVASMTSSTVYLNVEATLTFVTVGLANDVSRPWIKLVIGDTTCSHVPGPSDAVAGAAGQLTYASGTEGTLALTVGGSATSGMTGHLVCFATTQGGTYAVLTGGMATQHIMATPAATVTGVTPSSFTGIQGGVGTTIETSGAGANSAVFTIHNTGSGAYTFAVTTAGTLYDSAATADKIVILGSDLGGVDGANDCTLTVTGAIDFASLNSAHSDVTETSTAGAGSAMVTVHTTGSGGAYTFTVTTAGTNYASGDTLVILGSALGGVDGTNDCTITTNAAGGFAGTAAGTPAAIGATGPTSLSVANVVVTGSPVVLAEPKQNILTTVTFTGTNFVSSSMPYIKVVANAAACSTTAVAGGTESRLTWVSATSATLGMTLAAAPAVGLVVCYSATSGGTYADAGVALSILTTPDATVRSTPDTTVAHSAIGYYNFVTTDLLQTGIVRPWIHLIASGGVCGTNSPVTGGEAYQLDFLSATQGSAQFTITDASLAAGQAVTICYSPPAASAPADSVFVALAAGTQDITLSSAGPTSSPTVAPSAAPTVVAPTPPTAAPTSAPTSPTGAPTFDPTSAPSTVPTTAVPTKAPTHSPSNAPTTAAPLQPSATPTARPWSISPTTASPTDDTWTPSAVPSVAPTQAPTPPTSAPTTVPTVYPTTGPTGGPTTAVPTTAPTTAEPTYSPTTAPTNVPTPPTARPTTAPSREPTAHPSISPTIPTSAPTSAPTAVPTPPTSAPTGAPTTTGYTYEPTWAPSHAPSSAAPTNSPAPTTAPTKTPTTTGETYAPSKAPTFSPTIDPTVAPTAPTFKPTAMPSVAPTVPTPQPSGAPTTAPTAAPTQAPFPTTMPT